MIPINALRLDHIVNVQSAEDALTSELLLALGPVRTANNPIGDFLNSESNLDFLNKSLGHSYPPKAAEPSNILRGTTGKKKRKRERGERKYGKRDERKVETGAEAKNGGTENERRDRNLFKTLYDISKLTVPMKTKIVTCTNRN